jgi:hypothetical protein
LSRHNRDAANAGQATHPPHSLAAGGAPRRHSGRPVPSCAPTCRLRVRQALASSRRSPGVSPTSSTYSARQLHPISTARSPPTGASATPAPPMRRCVNSTTATVNRDRFAAAGARHAALHHRIRGPAKDWPSGHRCGKTEHLPRQWLRRSGCGWFLTRIASPGGGGLVALSLDSQIDPTGGGA